MIIKGGGGGTLTRNLAVAVNVVTGPLYQIWHTHFTIFYATLFSFYAYFTLTLFYTSFNACEATSL